jgi:uncharacterized metal-binding protein YceD (DUF177 family)
MSEFARPVRLDALGGAPRAMALVADASERESLAARFGLPAIGRLEAQVELACEGAVVTLGGRLVAEVTQSCVATGEPIAAGIDVPLALRFEPLGSLGEGENEVELSAEDCDVVEYEGAAIDVGEAVAQSLALALDPFPRCPDAEERLRTLGVLDEGEAGPFAALAGLKERLAGDS